jgi:hypothetical protein
VSGRFQLDARFGATATPDLNARFAATAQITAASASCVPPGDGIFANGFECAQERRAAPLRCPRVTLRVMRRRRAVPRKPPLRDGMLPPAPPQRPLGGILDLGGNDS